MLTIALNCRERSTTSPGPTTCPASDVPAMRGMIPMRWPPRKEDDLPHIVLGLRKRHGQGHLLVFRGIRRAEPAHRPVIKQFALKPAGQLTNHSGF